MGQGRIDCRIRPSPSGSHRRLGPDATGRGARRWSSRRAGTPYLPVRLRAGGFSLYFNGKERDMRGHAWHGRCEQTGLILLDLRREVFFRVSRLPTVGLGELVKRQFGQVSAIAEKSQVTNVEIGV